MKPKNAKTTKGILGVDFGGTRTKVRFGEEFKIYEESFKNETEDKILQFLQEAVSSSVQGFQALGVALACTMVPSIDSTFRRSRRISEHSTKFAELSKNVSGNIDMLEERWKNKLGIPVFILNDGEAAAIAEYEVGAAQGYNNVMVMTLGTSIGVGFIFDGSLYIGSYTSRASHILLDPNDEWCRGENHRGCWKVLASEDALKKLANKMGLPPDPIKVTAMAEDNNIKARLCYEYYAEKVAVGIANIIGAVPIDCVVIGGGIALAGDLLLQPLKERLRKGDLLDYLIALALEIKRAECPEPVVLGVQLYAEKKLDESL
jgi:glucokinase